MIFQIRVSQDVARKSADQSGTRRRTVDTATGPRTLVFSATPVFLVCDALPLEIAADTHLLVQPVETADNRFPDDVITKEVVGGEVINLKAERVQEPEGTTAPPAPALETTQASRAAAVKPPSKKTAPKKS